MRIWICIVTHADFRIKEKNRIVIMTYLYTWPLRTFHGKMKGNPETSHVITLRHPGVMHKTTSGDLDADFMAVDF
jgi:hypothetical protein